MTTSKQNKDLDTELEERAKKYQNACNRIISPVENKMTLDEAKAEIRKAHQNTKKPLRHAG